MTGILLKKGKFRDRCLREECYYKDSQGNKPGRETFLMFKFSFRTRASVSWSKFNSSAITLTVNHVFESAKSLTFSAFSWVPPHDRMTVHHLRHFLTYSKTSRGSQNSLLWLLLLLQCRISCLQIADWFHFLKITFFSTNNTNEFM